MTAPVLQLDHLGKRYLANARPLARLQDALRGGGSRTDAVWAFRGICLTINAGTSLGVIGMNGAGKSTFLATLAGILPPDEGVLSVHGKTAALLELAAGFHPDFSPAENIRLNLTVQGMDRHNQNAALETIQAFAGIGEAFQAPVRTLSAGMLLRAAYAQITALSFDILMVDEVLAVGDAAFQSRCYAHLRQLRKAGKTLVLVSHDLGALVEHCDQILVLDRGHAAFLGPPDQAVNHYRREILRADGRLPQTASPGNHSKARIQAIRILDANDNEVNQHRSGDPVRLELEIAAESDLSHWDCGIEFHTQQGWMLGAVSSRLAGIQLPALIKGETVRVVFEQRLPFTVDRVILHAGITSNDTLDTPGEKNAPDPELTEKAVFLDRREGIATLEFFMENEKRYGAVSLQSKVRVHRKSD